MKNLLFFLSLFITSIAFGQTFDPNTGTVSNRPYSPAQGVPTDNRSYFYDADNFVWRAYKDTSEVLNYLNLSKYRTGQFAIIVNTGGALSNGVITGGINEAWWFKNGTADSNLVRIQTIYSVNGQTGTVVAKNADSLRGLPVDTTNNTNGYVVTFDKVNKKFILQSAGGVYTAGTGISIDAGTKIISALNGSPLWNANQLRGRNISTTAPQVGQFLGWSGLEWVPNNLASDSTKLDTAYYNSDTLYLVYRFDTISVYIPAGSGSIDSSVMASKWYVDSSLTEVETFYNSDGTLSGNRNIEGASQSLTFNNFSAYDIFSNGFTVNGAYGELDIGGNNRVTLGKGSLGHNLFLNFDKVGINTSSPQQALHIKGQLKIDTITNDPSPDSLATIIDGVPHKINISELKVTPDEVNTGSIDNRYITPYALQNSKYTSTNPGLYFAPEINMNPGFIVMASVIVRPSSSYSSGQPVTWERIITGGHNSSYFTSVNPETSGELSVHYPPVKNILNITITPDETLAQNGIIVGPSVGDSMFTAQIRRVQSAGIKLTGNGSGGWTKSSQSGFYDSFFDVTSYNTSDGSTSLNISTLYGTDYNSLMIAYNGTNRYFLQRKYTGLGSYNAKFVLVDTAGNPVLTNPTTSDVITISNAGMYSAPVNAYIYGANNTFLTGLANFWITGLFECWMVASPASSSSIQVRWQTNYPSASTYKLYRDTDSTFSSPVLIHTGTEGVYVDSGLSSNTMYYYKLYGVVSGSDKYISRFNTNTY